MTHVPWVGGLAETRRHYEMASALYGQAVAQSKVTQLKIERKRAAVLKSQVSCLYPALAAADKWLTQNQDPMPVKQHLEIPVLCMRMRRR